MKNLKYILEGVLSNIDTTITDMDKDMIDVHITNFINSSDLETSKNILNAILEKSKQISFNDFENYCKTHHVSMQSDYSKTTYFYEELNVKKSNIAIIPIEGKQHFFIGTMDHKKCYWKHLTMRFVQERTSLLDHFDKESHGGWFGDKIYILPKDIAKVFKKHVKF